MNYYLTYEDWTWISDPGDPSDDQWRYRGVTDCNVVLKGLYRSAPDAPHETPHPSLYENDEVGDLRYAYVVVILYHTGDTFGSDGRWLIAAVKESEEAAQEVVKRVEANDCDQAYCPWEGYFERLDEARIERMVVLP
jgi:hypothetical protein